MSSLWRGFLGSPKLKETPRHSLSRPSAVTPCTALTRVGRCFLVCPFPPPPPPSLSSGACVVWCTEVSQSPRRPWHTVTGIPQTSGSVKGFIQRGRSGHIFHKDALNMFNRGGDTNTPTVTASQVSGKQRGFRPRWGRSRGP